MCKSFLPVFFLTQGSSKETPAQLAKPVSGGQEHVFVGACLGWEQVIMGSGTAKLNQSAEILGESADYANTKSGVLRQEAHAHDHAPHPEDDTTMRPGLFAGALFLQRLYNDAKVW